MDKYLPFTGYNGVETLFRREGAAGSYSIRI
jgi:hypothetical protein